MEPARVEVDLGFFPLMWILFLISPWLAINGNAARSRWGKHQMVLPPGRTMFEAWYPYLFSKRTSPAQLMLDLQPGAVYRIKYRPAWVVFLPGSMKVVEAPSLPPATVRQLPPS